MKVQELVGSRVWLKPPDRPETTGHIMGITKPVDLRNIESSINASTFTIELASGDVIETSGFNLYKIDHAGYIQESGKRR